VRIAAALAEATARVERIERAERLIPTMEKHGAAFGVQIAIEAMADALASSNPRFDRDRFIAAAEGGAA